MSKVEQRLLEAAEETRRVARHAVPPPLEAPRRQYGGWLVFAAAFAAIVLAIGVIPLLSRPGGPEPAATSPTSPPATTAVDPTTTSIMEQPMECSAAGMAAPVARQRLPEPVADARSGIITAAIACDFDDLAGMAAPDLVTSFGGGGFDDIVRWEEEGSDPLATIVTLLDMSHAIQEMPDGSRLYVWPAAFVYDRWEDIPSADVEELLALYSEEELDQLSGFGSYAGWRVGITEAGEWIFFVAGD